MAVTGTNFVRFTRHGIHRDPGVLAEKSATV